MSNRSNKFECLLADTDLATARTRVIEALAAEGFGVLTEIDVAATLAKKLGATFRPYTILGACNPEFAHRALTMAPELGLFLPCNVVLEQAEGGTAVSIVNPRALFGLVDCPEAEPLVEEASERLRRVAQALT